MSNEDLILRLAGLPLGRSEHEGALGFAVLDAAENDEPYQVRVRCEVDNLGKRMHVRCHLAGRATSSCHRCLNVFERCIDTSFELTLQKGLEGVRDDDIVYVPEHATEFDLSPYVREAVILDEPIQLLCKTDCLGLCPRCGADLNLGRCGCAPGEDERWEPLRDLSMPPEF